MVALDPVLQLARTVAGVSANFKIRDDDDSRPNNLCLRIPAS
jgi:hypothetical protein